MKAPLRYALGWVIYVAIFAVMNPLILLLANFMQLHPFVGTISLALSLVVFIFMFCTFIRRFVNWLSVK